MLQTSADANISGQATGAMTWAFLETMKQNANPSYAQVRQQSFLDHGRD